VSARNQREGKRRQEKMKDRRTQSMPRTLTVYATRIEISPKISCGCNQAE